jgi:hypothetical protein
MGMAWVARGGCLSHVRRRPWICTRSRFKLNVSAGSQKRTIHVFHEPEGRVVSRFALKNKKKHRLELQVTIVRYILSLLGQTLSLLGQLICLGLRTFSLKRLRVSSGDRGFVCLHHEQEASSRFQLNVTAGKSTNRKGEMSRASHEN